MNVILIYIVMFNADNAICFWDKCMDRLNHISKDRVSGLGNGY